MSAILSNGHKSRLVSLCLIERALSGAIVPRFATHYREWLSNLGDISHIGLVPVSTFHNLSPEDAASVTLKRVLLLCAEFHPTPVPVHKVITAVGLDVAHGPDAQVGYLRDLGTRLVELLVESSSLVEIAAISDSQGIKLHPEWAKRFRSCRAASSLSRTVRPAGPSIVEDQPPRPLRALRTRRELRADCYG